MLRTCNIVRIAGVPVLRNDGQGYALAPAHGAGTGRAGLKPAPTSPPARPPSKPPSLYIIHYQLSIDKTQPPLGRGAAVGGGVVSPAGRNPVQAKKALLFRGGCRPQAAGGAELQKVNTIAPQQNLRFTVAL
ncbi:MAG: hypothetical protein LBM98_00200 [Oscillospiraceae bacterium]|nr:hypothetical protein [Oscillospiraceae bacterium]